MINLMEIVKRRHIKLIKYKYFLERRLARMEVKMEKAKVYFTKEITQESIVKMYEVLGKKLTRKSCGKITFRRKR